MNESSKSYLKNDSFAKTLGSNAKKLLNKENFKTHTKTFSVEIKSDKSKSPIPTIKSVNNMKDLLTGNNNSNHSNVNSSQNILASLNKNTNNTSNSNLIHHHSNYKTTKTSNLNNNKGNVNSNNNSSNNINITNNNNNNLNSYTSNGNIVKNEINLRNYIMSRVNKSNAKPLTSHGKSGNNNNVHINGKVSSGPGHFRSNSNNIFG